MKKALSKVDLIKDLQRLGISEGMEMIIHSSLSSIGYVDGGANAVIQSLVDAVGEKAGTVIVPTITGNAEEGPNKPPIFNVNETRSWTGAIPETFRKRSDAVRSLNPTHSVAAIGASAVNLTTGHEDCMTPCGFGSPYFRISRRKGKILLIGTTLKSNTSLHMVEDLADVKFHLQPEPTECMIINQQGNTLNRSVILHKWGTWRRYPVLHDVLLEKGIMKEGLIGQAKSFLIDSHLMVEYTTELLKKDPYYLIHRSHV
ncbi:aminoglycoside N(3)-acetyltransferase [Radiobacillus sp. PE A8.2]|uniref:aminoglycoside N(3)-acetyltransferase n=1 Tax=Radiobacillus sp. PE A8.2 TaxID=3380349 RepID=UPI00388F4767